ncbi:helix-turn-helix transcriptional regulator [Dictyobacter aurantiacus]|uniref:DNA-binding response regulator n=1 Tax=Dictyobacter aurantiacus TaxID=1936993 RepID=A0A401ZDB2_9CHLR|nr:response regulator transcription factor family protein [Dictyobacter aurantiacus]GCE04874.1 hypothetical protein KDAU_22030 [Dictyobacter aurantiacus]
MSTYPHDQLIHTLSALLIELHTLQLLVRSNEAGDDPAPDLQAIRAGIDELEALTHEALTIVRSSFEDEPAPELDGVELTEALSRAVEETAERLHLASRISFSGVDEQNRPLGQTLPPEAARLLYRVVREALYQVPRHSDARRLRFTFSYRQDDVQVSVEDDGIPGNHDIAGDAQLDRASPLLDMSRSASQILWAPVWQELRSRVEQWGGTLQLEQMEERGVRVRVSLSYLSTSPMLPEASQGSNEPSAKIFEQLLVSENTATAERVTVLIVDGLAVTRAGLHRLLESYPGLSVVGEAVDGVQAVSETLELGPQVVLMDTQLPNGQSLEALRQIKQLNLDTRVLLLATQDREEYLYETLRAGADGFVLKDIAPDELVQAVRTVARGEMLVQSQLAGRLLSRFGRQGRGGAPYETLTARELEVLRLLARGLRNKEIAARLFVSERTVNFHLANIYQKLGVSGRTEALSKALEQGLVTT